jgi:disulfide bond formation protein DsbB
LNIPNETKIKPKCKNCQIIRIFLLSVVFIILLSLIQSDKLHYLKIITPYNAAFLIIFLGLIMFCVKLTKHFVEKRK